MYTDLRKGRRSEIGRLYHVTAATRARERLFADFGLGRIVVRELMLLDAEGRTETLCYMLMPDHLHWLVELRKGSLAEAMQRLKGRSARRAGRPLWQANYFDHALRREESVEGIARYIVANPLRAGLVTALGDHPHWDARWLHNGPLL
jgi:REP element-mobilizing transposase RayT